MKFKIDDFNPISPKKLIEILETNKEKQKPFTFPLLNIDYVELYSFLKFKYGTPNGMQSLLRSDDSDNLFHWNYTLMNDQLIIDFVYSFRSVNINIIGSEKETNQEMKNDIINMIDSALKDNRKESNKIRQSLEYWDLFQNTFLRLNDTVNHFYSVYMNNYPEEPVKPTYTFSKNKIEDYLNKTKENLEKINIIKSYGLSLRMLIPVLGESFINFILFILGKDEIKNDKRTFETITRNNIDARVKTLHLYVNGLDKPISQSNDFVKRFFKLMANRNDFLHGNVMPRINTFDNVYFDGKIPIFKEPRDMNKEFSTQALFQISKEEIEKDYKTINGFIEYILDCINDEFRYSLNAILQTRELGWNKNKKSIGILFPPYIIDSFPSEDS